MLMCATAISVAATMNTNTENKSVQAVSETNTQTVWLQPNNNPESLSRTDYIHYDDGSCENSLGLTSGGTIHEAIKLTPAELGGYTGYSFTKIKVMHGCPLYPGAIDTPYTMWIYTNANHPTGDPLAQATLVASGTSNVNDDYFEVTLATPYAFAPTDTVWLGVGWTHAAGQFPMGFDTSTPSAGVGGWLWYSGGWFELDAIGYPGSWNLEAGVDLVAPDTTPPVTTCSITGTNPVTITLTATDDNSGVNHTYYKIDDGSYATYTAPVQVSVPGEHTVYFYSTDMAGNTETEKSQDFTIEAPITITLKGGFGITATIKNTGTTNLTNIDWTIELDGKLIFLGKSKSGTIPTLAAGEEYNAKDFVIGFGKTGITATAGGVSATEEGTAILFFVIGI
jgi:hypothetical protein